MRNFISEDDIEQATILVIQLKVEAVTNGREKSICV